VTVSFPATRLHDATHHSCKYRWLPALDLNRLNDP
jgi:hypothetical protein